MLNPSFSAAATTSPSLIEPPGWIIQDAPLLAISSILSLNGKKASEAATASLNQTYYG